MPHVRSGLAFAAGLLMAIVNVVDIAGHKYEFVAYPEASVGVGLWLVAAGALLSLAAAIAAFVERP